MTVEQFEPTWVSAPMATIYDVLESRDLAVDELASILDLSTSAFKEGKFRIGAREAAILSETLGGSVQFWLQRDRQYREDRERHALLFSDAEAAWVSAFSISEMKRLGWLAPAKSPKEALLSFFDVASISDFQDKYRSLANAVSFRTSSAFGINLGAVLAWLREGEIESYKIDTASWDRNLLRRQLPAMRKLVGVKPPKIFFPDLRALCASAGVALVVVPAPNGCRASGATWFTSDGKAVCLLSHRYGTDDQFWFTFFHEMAHLVLHKDKAMFLENGDALEGDEESEANEFARQILVPDEWVDSLQKVRHTHLEVAKLARRIKVSPGVVVGQMQHMKILPHGWLQKLKKRYDWRFLSAE